VVDDISPLLDLWDQDLRPAAKRHMIDFANENVTCIREARKLSNTFWAERRTQMRQVQDWFISHDFGIAFAVATSITTNEEICADLAQSIRRRFADD
jgi:hypothetical protein